MLQKNPGYFRQGRPYLDKITFKTIGGDQAAYQAMQAGQADAYEGISTPALVDQASKQPNLTTTQMLSTSPYVIQLNTTAPPFDDQKARDAVYYATDAEAIRKGLFNNRYPNSQTFTGPGGLFYKPTVPGYKTFDLEKAKQLVAGAGRPAGDARHDQRARRQADHRGAAEPVGEGRDQDEDRVLRPGRAHQGVRRQVAVDAADGRVPGIRRSAWVSASGSPPTRRSRA